MNFLNVYRGTSDEFLCHKMTHGRNSNNSEVIRGPVKALKIIF